MPTAADIKSVINAALADNNTRAITEAILRDTLNGLVDWTTEYNPTWVSRGAWSSATAYVLNDYVTYNGSTYRCKVAHTNQAVTNVTYWEVVASKGNDGNALRVFGDSLFNLPNDNSSTMANKVVNVTADTVPIVEFNGIGAATYFTSNVAIALRLDRLYSIECDFKRDTAGNTYICLLNYDKNDAQIGLTNGAEFNNVGGFSSQKRFFGGTSASDPFKFNASTVYGKFFIVVNTAGKSSVKNFVFKEVPIELPVPSNLAWLPDGQAVYDSANAAKIGVYVNSTVGIVWLNKEVIALAPNGTSISMVINRPYKWTWALLYNDGVTVVTLPSATIAKDTSATFVLTGTAGKTYSIVIYPSV